MNHGKCGNCGLVNPASVEKCQRCEHNINKNWKPVDLSTAPSEQAKKSSSLLPLVFLLVLAGGGYAFWQLGASGSKESIPVPTTSAASATQQAKVPVGEKPIMGAALEPANANQQSKTYADTIKSSKAVTDAENRAKEVEQVTRSAPKPLQKKS